MTATEQKPINREVITTLAQAFRILGIVGGVSSQDQINSAFRAKAKAAHESGNYAGDMDALTQAKDLLTNALKEIQEQAQIDQARQRASQQEAEERARQEAARKQKDKKPTKPEPLRLGPAKAPSYRQGLDALRTYERKKAREREQARRSWSCYVSEEQARTRQARLDRHQNDDKRGGSARAMQPPQPGGPEPGSKELAKPQTGDDPIESTFYLFQQRQEELEQTRQRERGLEEALGRARSERQKLEHTVEKASAVADQLRAILEGEEKRA